MSNTLRIERSEHGVAASYEDGARWLEVVRVHGEKAQLALSDMHSNEGLSVRIDPLILRSILDAVLPPATTEG